MTYPKRSLPVIPMIFVIGILLLAIIWFTRPKSVTAKLDTQSFIDPLSSTDVRVVINGTDRTEDLKNQSPTPYKYRSPSSLKLSDISFITEKNRQPVLVFLDGSQLTVSNQMRQELPGDIQVRINYEGPRN